MIIKPFDYKIPKSVLIFSTIHVYFNHKHKKETYITGLKAAVETTSCFSFSKMQHQKMKMVLFRI
jgi:hypothetical protein